MLRLEETKPLTRSQNDKNMTDNGNDDLLTAARITVVYLMLYGTTFANTNLAKKRAARQHRNFDRYNNNSPSMLVADRLQGNFLEWSPVFLGLLWSLAATFHLSSTTAAAVAAWIYVALRALYIVLILLRRGVNSQGRNSQLWISTFPAYVCLLCMLIEALKAFFLDWIEDTIRAPIQK